MTTEELHTSNQTALRELPLSNGSLDGKPFNCSFKPTRIQIYLNPQLFLSGFKNFHLHTCPDSL